MPGSETTYHFTFHAYRSWRADDPRGYVRKGKGIQPPDEQMAEWYDRDASCDAVRFDRTAQQAIVDEIGSLCQRKDWRLRYACATPTHVHVLVSWDGYVPWNDVRVAMKRRMGRALSLALDGKGPWLSRGQDSRRQVMDAKHLEHLVEAYLPKREHRGVHWCEGQGVWEQ